MNEKKVYDNVFYLKFQNFKDKQRILNNFRENNQIIYKVCEIRIIFDFCEILEVGKEWKYI